MCEVKCMHLVPTLILTSDHPGTSSAAVNSRLLVEITHNGIQIALQSELIRLTVPLLDVTCLLLHWWTVKRRD